MIALQSVRGRMRPAASQRQRCPPMRCGSAKASYRHNRRLPPLAHANMHCRAAGRRMVHPPSGDLQDALKAPQNVHRTGATAPRCLASECKHSPGRVRIGKNNCGGIVATPATVIAGQRPKRARFGFTRARVRHWRAGLVCYPAGAGKACGREGMKSRVDRLRGVSI